MNHYRTRLFGTLQYICYKFKEITHSVQARRIDTYRLDYVFPRSLFNLLYVVRILTTFSPLPYVRPRETCVQVPTLL